MSNGWPYSGVRVSEGGEGESKGGVKGVRVEGGE